MLPKPDQPCKNNIAVITIGNVQVMAGGNPPSKVKLTCGSQWKWNYSAKAGQPNCAAIMTVGNRIKISYDVAESTSFPGTMMKFINEAVPAAPGELDSWDSKEPWTGGNTGSGNSTSSNLSTASAPSPAGDKYRTPVQMQRSDVLRSVATLQAGSGIDMETFLNDCDKALAWADTAADASFPVADGLSNTVAGSDEGLGVGGAASLPPLSGLASIAVPNGPDADDDIPF